MYIVIKVKSGGTIFSLLSGTSVADLEGVRVVRLNPPLGPNYLNFIGEIYE